MKAIGYVRVSTEGQEISIEAQKAKIQAYANLYDVELVEIIEDFGVSAKSLNREGLQRGLQMLENSEASAMIILKLDRLTRNVSDLGYLLTNYFTDRFALMSVSEQFDTRTAAGRLVLNVMASVAQWERETIVERTRTALQYKKSKGERTGSVPYGYSLGSDGKTLVVNPQEQAIIEAVKEYKAAGLSLREIAQRLESIGNRNRNGRTFNPKTITRLAA